MNYRGHNTVNLPHPKSANNVFHKNKHVYSPTSEMTNSPYVKHIDPPIQ